MVTGHEIVGRVTRVGAQVKRFKVGDLAGVGCFVDSCRVCASCKAGLEQYCENHLVLTYNGTEKDEKTPTYGGYSSQIVVDENYTLKISSKLPLANVAPLLCAGITTYSPLRHFNVGPGSRVGVIGLGGLGHMAVKLAASMGADVTVLSTSKPKEKDASRLGAKHFVATKEPGALEALQGRFSLIMDTVSTPHDLNKQLTLLRNFGTMVLVGLPPSAAQLDAFTLVHGNRRIAGSNIGGIPETQEMLDYCGKNGIVADVEVIKADQINDAYERMERGDVRYRFVIDAASLGD